MSDVKSLKAIIEAAEQCNDAENQHDLGKAVTRLRRVIDEQAHGNYPMCHNPDCNGKRREDGFCCDACRDSKKEWNAG